MTLNINIDRRIRVYLLTRLPKDNTLTPYEHFSVRVESIIEAMPDVRPNDVIEQIRTLYVGSWWFSNDHGQPVPEETVTRYSELRPTAGWTFRELREALEQPPTMTERRKTFDFSLYHRGQERR